MRKFFRWVLFALVCLAALGIWRERHGAIYLPFRQITPIVSATEAGEGNVLLVNAWHPLPEDYQPAALVNLYEQRHSFLLASSEIWLESIRPGLKESSVVKYGNIIKVHLLPYFSGMNVVDITSADILAFCNSLLQCSGKGGAALASKTIADIMTVLKAIYRFTSEKNGYENAIRDWPSVSQTHQPLRILSLPEQNRLSLYL